MLKKKAAMINYRLLANHLSQWVTKKRQVKAKLKRMVLTLMLTSQAVRRSHHHLKRLVLLRRVNKRMKSLMNLMI